MAQAAAPCARFFESWFQSRLFQRALTLNDVFAHHFAKVPFPDLRAKCALPPAVLVTTIPLPRGWTAWAKGYVERIDPLKGDLRFLRLPMRIQTKCPIEGMETSLILALKEGIQSSLSQPPEPTYFRIQTHPVRSM